MSDGSKPVQDKSPLRRVKLFTDGACSGNPGPGGWAFILRDEKTGKELTGSGGEPETTNNRMEMQAVIEGLKALKRRCRVDLYSDSNYVLQGLKTWMAGWKRNGWMRREKGRSRPVKNVELWQQLDRLLQLHDVRFHHVRGHSGHPENERCDQMAVAASQQVQRRR
ncbi:MAG: ribonuclease H [Pirellulaceae bacterium]|nr:MAG: ribonuclease H [Pirellulaceae bacterium]